MHLAYIGPFLTEGERGIYLDRLNNEIFWNLKSKLQQQFLCDRTLSPAGKQKFKSRVSRN